MTRIREIAIALILLLFVYFLIPGVRTDVETPQSGVILYNVPDEGRAVLMNANKEVVREWRDPQEDYWEYVRLSPKRELFVVVPQGIKKFSWEGKLLYQLGGPAHHDLDILDDGGLLYLSYEVVDKEIPRRRKEDGTRDAKLKMDVVVELDSNGIEVWRWKLAEHLDEVFTVLEIDQQEYFEKHNGRGDGQRGLWDFSHSNTVQQLPSSELGEWDARFRPGNILLSIRNLNAVIIINRETGVVEWGWGPGVIERQHTPAFLPNGRVLVFDNGSYRKRSRLLEIDPVIAKVRWEYGSGEDEFFFSPSRGGVQRLPNGNSLITNVWGGTIFEVTPKKKIVWQFTEPKFQQLLTNTKSPSPQMLKEKTIEEVRSDMKLFRKIAMHRAEKYPDEYFETQ